MTRTKGIITVLQETRHLHCDAQQATLHLEIRDTKSDLSINLSENYVRWLIK